MGNIREVQTATESERKYDVPEDFVLPQLAGAGDAETHDLDATYFDTEDLRLARNKRTLRRRTGGSDAGWHLKTPGDGSSRAEHRLPPDGDGVPDELVSEVRAIVRAEPLRPVARLRTHRVETPLRDDAGRILALVAQDQVSAETDGHQQHWQEIEVELVDGDPELLDAVERELIQAGARPATGPSKLARALGDRLDTVATSNGQGQNKIKKNPVLRYAREQRDAIQEYDPGVRHGDPEAVHKMRVATRRLRSTLRTFKRSFPQDQVEFLQPELKWLAGELGEVRDGQVLEHKLLDAVNLEGPEFTPVADRIREHLDAKIENGRQALARDLDGPRYLRLLDAVDELVDSAPPANGSASPAKGWASPGKNSASPGKNSATPGKDSASPGKDSAAPGKSDPVKRARKVLRKADRLLDEATLGNHDEPLHEARKAYKKARYAVEVFVPSVGKPAKKLTKRLTDLQDVLGAHQDSVVAREILSDLAGGAGEAFPYGVLHARQEQIGRDTLGNLPGVVGPARKRKIRRWLG